jgi:hypothetical protein
MTVEASSHSSGSSEGEGREEEATIKNVQLFRDSTKEHSNLSKDVHHIQPSPPRRIYLLTYRRIITSDNLVFYSYPVDESSSRAKL